MMESEIVDEIPECGMTSLHVGETETLLNKKDELLKSNFYEKETKLTPIQVNVDAQGQVVPAHSPSCFQPENEASQNNEHSTVPQDTLEIIDCREESEHLLQVHQDEFLEGEGLEKLTSTEQAMKTFLWRPIGFKDKIIEPLAPIDESGAQEQVVLQKKNEKIITFPEEVPIINNVNQSEEHSSQEEENNKLTSILKKSDSGLKKTVHFPKNIVSVKFYDVSDEEESDNDTEILSDPEEDDLKDQEVPFNTYDDYDPHCCHPTSINFIPQFTFPPILKIANCHLYEDIDDHDEQIMAIMEDDDGRERLYASDLVADKIYYQQDTSGFHGDVPTSQDGITQSEDPEKALSDIRATQEPIIKNGIERNEDKLEMIGYRNMAGSFEFENLEVNQQTPAKDKTIPETAKEELDVHLPITKTGIEQQNVNGDQNDHQTSMKIKTIFVKPEEVEMNTPVTKTGIERLVNEKNTNEHKCDDTSTEITSFENLAEDKQIIEVHRLTTRNKVKPLEDDLQINEFAESESSVMKENPLVLATFDQRIGNPAMIQANSSFVNNDTNVKVAEVNKLDAKVYTLLDALKATPNNSVELTRKGRFIEENFVQQVASPKFVLEGKNSSMISLPESEIPKFYAQQLHKMQAELPKLDMVKKWLLATQSVVTSSMTDATFGTTENVDLLEKEISKENAVKKQEAANATLQNDVFAVSNENSHGCTAAPSSARAFHGSCGSNFLWRGSRSISSMILDENFQVPILPVAKNEISYPLAKEEVTFSKVAIINVKSLESNIVAPAVWEESVATESCSLEVVKFEKYDHSFLSSPDHLNEFEELEESESNTEFPNKKQRGESHTSNTCLKHSNFGNGKSLVLHETGLHEHQIVPDMLVQDQFKTQPMKDSPRAVPSGNDDIVTMDTTNSSLHLDDFPQQNLSTLKNHEILKEDSVIPPVPCLSNSQTSMLATQLGRRTLRVGLSKRTRVKSLHPYWSKEKIKQSESIP